MDNLLKKLNINETYTKTLKKVKNFNAVKDNIPLKQDYNFMADLLMLPTTKKVHYLVWWKGYKKADATYEPIEMLKKDVPELIREYEST